MTRALVPDLARWDVISSQERRAAAETVGLGLSDFVLLQMETFSCGGKSHEVAIFRHERTGLEFVLIPAGVFDMGSPITESHRGERELLHPVTLTRPFLISRTEVTQAVWTRVMGTNPSSFSDPDGPVDTVSWNEATQFCDKLGLRLPTEAEWEYACRAGTTTSFDYGDREEALGDYGWYDDNSNGRSHAVGQKRPNAFGLLDMHGNLWEWCADRYGPYGAGATNDPTGPDEGTARVFRGGSFNRPARDARSAFRFGYEDSSSRWVITRRDHRFDSVGFRPAR